MLLDISLSNTFLDLSPQARATKAKINKWDYTIQPSNTTISLLGIYPRKPELKDRMYPNVLCSTIVNSQDMEAT